MNMDLPKRKSHRLKNYDYGNGYFFVTICTNDKRNLLCDIVGNDAHIVPSNLGKRIIECSENIEKLNDNVEIIKYVIMPNHIHGIIAIENQSELYPQKQYGF